MKDLNTPGGTSSWARAVNGNGVVAGISYTRNGDTQAFASDGSGMVAINPFGGGGADVTTVNDKGGRGWGLDAWQPLARVCMDSPRWRDRAQSGGFTGNSYVAALTTDGLMAGSSCSLDPSGERCHATMWKPRSKR